MLVLRGRASAEMGAVEVEITVLGVNSRAGGGTSSQARALLPPVGVLA
jgi:hypothetical protein